MKSIGQQQQQKRGEKKNGGRLSVEIREKRGWDYEAVMTAAGGRGCVRKRDKRTRQLPQTEQIEFFKKISQ